MTGERVLVLDGEERASLAVARSLVRAGFNVTVAAAQRSALAAVSRGVRATVLRQSALHDPAAYAAEVAAFAHSAGVRLVIPVTDGSVEAILEHRELLPLDATIPTAPLSVYRAASNKLLVHRIACEVGLGIAESAVVERYGDPAPDDPSLYPGVAKPHRSVVGTVSRHKTTVRMILDRTACDVALRQLPAEAFPVLIQRRVRGPGEGYFTARWGGRTVATFAHRRLREKPPSGGVSVCRESISVDPAWQRACEELLDRLDWQGVAMVECKRDLRIGTSAKRQRYNSPVTSANARRRSRVGTSES